MTYPFEIFCTRCDKVILHIARRLGINEKILFDECQYPNGNKPQPSDRLSCRCLGVRAWRWAIRERATV